MSAPEPGKTREEIEAKVKKHEAGGDDRPGGSKEALEKAARDIARETGSKEPTDQKLLTTKTGGGGNRPSEGGSGGSNDGGDDGGDDGGSSRNRNKQGTKDSTTTQQEGEVTGSKNTEKDKDENPEEPQDDDDGGRRPKPKDPVDEDADKDKPNFLFHGGARNPLDFTDQGNKDKDFDPDRDIIRGDGKTRDGSLRNRDGSLKNPDGFSKDSEYYGRNLGIAKDDARYDPIVGWSGDKPIFSSDSANMNIFALTSHGGQEEGAAYDPDDPNSPGYNPIVRYENGVAIRLREAHGLEKGEEHGSREGDQYKDPEVIQTEDKLGAIHVSGDVYARPPTSGEEGYTLVNKDNEEVIDRRTGKAARFKTDEDMHKILREVTPDNYKRENVGGTVFIPPHGEGGSAAGYTMIKDGETRVISGAEYEKESKKAWEAQEPDFFMGHKIEYNHSPDPDIGFHWRVTDPEGNLVMNEGKPFFTKGAALDNFLNELPAKSSTPLGIFQSGDMPDGEGSTPSEIQLGGGFRMLTTGHDDGSDKGLTVVDKDNNKIELDGKDYFHDPEMARNALFAHDLKTTYGVDAVPPGSRRGEKDNWTLRNKDGNIITKDGEIFRPKERTSLLQFITDKGIGEKFHALDPLGLPYAHASTGKPIAFGSVEAAKQYEERRGKSDMDRYSPLFATRPDGELVRDKEGKPVQFSDPEERQEYYAREVNKNNDFINVLDPTGKPAIDESGKEVRVRKGVNQKYEARDKFDTMFTSGYVVMDGQGKSILGRDGGEIIVPTRTEANAIRNLNYDNFENNYWIIDAKTREPVRDEQGAIRTFNGYEDALEMSKSDDYILVPEGTEYMPQGFDTWGQLSKYAGHHLLEPADVITRLEKVDKAGTGAPIGEYLENKPHIDPLSYAYGNKPGSEPQRDDRDSTARAYRTVGLHLLPPSARMDDVERHIAYLKEPLKMPEPVNKIPEREHMYDEWETGDRLKTGTAFAAANVLGWGAWLNSQVSRPAAKNVEKGLDALGLGDNEMLKNVLTLGIASSRDDINYGDEIKNAYLKATMGKDAPTWQEYYKSISGLPKTDVSYDDHYKGTSGDIEGLVVVPIDASGKEKTWPHAINDWLARHQGGNPDIIPSNTPGVVFAPINSDTYKAYVKDVEGQSKKRDEERRKTIAQLESGVEKTGNHSWKIADPEGGYHKYSDGTEVEFPTRKEALAYIAVRGESIPHQEKYHNVFVDNKGGIIYEDGNVKHVLDKDYDEYVKKQNEQILKQNDPKYVASAQKQASLQAMIDYYNDDTKPKYLREQLQDDILAAGGYIEIPGEPMKATGYATDMEKPEDPDSEHERQKQYWESDDIKGNDDLIGLAKTLKKNPELANMAHIGAMFGGGGAIPDPFTTRLTALAQLSAAGDDNPSKKSMFLAQRGGTGDTLGNIGLSVSSLSDPDVAIGPEAANVPFFGLSEHQKWSNPEWHAEREKYGPNIPSQQPEADKYWQHITQSPGHAINAFNNMRSEALLAFAPDPISKVARLGSTGFLKLVRGRPIFQPIIGQKNRFTYHMDKSDTIPGKIARARHQPAGFMDVLKTRAQGSEFRSSTHGNQDVDGAQLDRAKRKFVDSQEVSDMTKITRSFTEMLRRDQPVVDKVYGNYVPTPTHGTVDEMPAELAIKFEDAVKAAKKRYNIEKKTFFPPSQAKISVEKGRRAEMSEGNIVTRDMGAQLTPDNPYVSTLTANDAHTRFDTPINGQMVDMRAEIQDKIVNKLGGTVMPKDDILTSSFDSDYAISGSKQNIREMGASRIVELTMDELGKRGIGQYFKPKLISGKGVPTTTGQDLSAHSIEYIPGGKKEDKKIAEFVDSGDPPEFDTRTGKALGKKYGDHKIHGQDESDPPGPFEIGLGKSADVTYSVPTEHARKEIDLNKPDDVKRHAESATQLLDPAFVLEATHRGAKDTWFMIEKALKMSVMHEKLGNARKAREWDDLAIDLNKEFTDATGWNLARKGVPEPGALMGRHSGATTMHDTARQIATRDVVNPLFESFDDLKQTARLNLGSKFDREIGKWYSTNVAKAQKEANDIYNKVARSQGKASAQKQKDQFLNKKIAEIDQRRAKLEADAPKRVDTTSKTFDRIIEGAKTDAKTNVDKYLLPDLTRAMKDGTPLLPKNAYDRLLTGNLDGLLGDTAKAGKQKISKTVDSSLIQLPTSGSRTNVLKQVGKMSKRSIKKFYDWHINKIKKEQPMTKWNETLEKLENKKIAKMEQLIGTNKGGAVGNGDTHRHYQVQYLRYRSYGYDDVEARKLAKIDAENFTRQETKRIELEYDRDLAAAKAKHKIWKKQYEKDLDKVKKELKDSIDAEKEMNPSRIVDTAGSILGVRGLGLAVSGGTLAITVTADHEAEALGVTGASKVIGAGRNISSSGSRYGSISKPRSIDPSSAITGTLNLVRNSNEFRADGQQENRQSSVLAPSHHKQAPSTINRVLGGDTNPASILNRGERITTPDRKISVAGADDVPSSVNNDHISSIFSKPSKSTINPVDVSFLLSKPSGSKEPQSTTSVLSMLRSLSKPSRSAPSEQSGSRPSISDPSISRPSGSRPSEPSGSKPSGSKPSGSKPSGSKPSGSKPSGSKPSGSKPSGSKPSGSKPSGSKPSGSKPSGSKPSGSKPISPIRTLLTPDLDEREAPQKKKDEKGPLFQTNVFANTFIGSRIDAPEITRNPKGHNILRSTERKSVFTGKVDDKLTGIFGTGPPKTPAAPRPAATGPPGYKPKPVAPKKAAESILASTVVPKSKKAKKKKGEEEEVPEGQGLAGLIGGVPTSSGGVIQPGGGIATLGGSGGGIAGLGTATADDVPKAGKRTGKGMPGLVDSGAGKTGADMGMGTTNLGMGSGKGTGRMQGADLGMGNGGSDLGLGGGKKPSNLLDGLGGVPGLKRRRKGLI